MKRETAAAALTLVVFVLGAAAAPGTARAWEPDSTHAGLTEQAALASRLHARLVALFGRKSGWLEPLSLPPERAPALYKKLALLEPSSGFVPDRAGRQSALAWLLAGSVLEGMPAEREQNHFYDPVAGKGLTGRDGAPLGVIVSAGVWGVGGAGVAAPDWIVAPANDLGLERFWQELDHAVTAPEPAERDEHLAQALLCAGAVLHVLEDAGAPARVRGDLDEFLLPLGGGPRDRGSRFERLAALLFGRLGVPAPGPAVARVHVRDFFTAADRKGLADVVNAGFYSSGTLPEPTLVPPKPRPGELPALVARAGRYPAPRPERELELTDRGGGAGGPDGKVLHGAGGVCLANYRVEDDTLRFAISDTCAATQLRVLLPLTGAYATGLLEHLFRGALAVVVAGGSAQATAPRTEAQLGAGTVTFLGEDAAGKRTPIGTAELKDGRASLAVPAGAVRIVAVFHGVDAQGDPLVAVGSSIAP